MPDRVVICDTSPLIYLHHLQQVPLLAKLYEKIIVPSAVAEEIETGIRLGYPGPDLDAFTWLQVRNLPLNQSSLIIPDLGPGESEVISMALAYPGCLVIMDEAIGRQVAKINDISVTGTAGVLLKAKREGWMSSLADCLERLVRSGFWFDEETRLRLLDLAEEFNR